MRSVDGRQALPFIRTKDFHVTMQDFIVAWNNVKSSPLSMESIIQSSKLMETPLIVRHYSASMQMLVKACAMLQQEWGDRPFFLSARTAARIMGSDTMTAWRAIQELQFDRVLRLEMLGTIRGKRASQWRYIGDAPRHVSEFATQLATALAPPE